MLVGFDPLPDAMVAPLGSRAVRFKDARLLLHDSVASTCPAASITTFWVIVAFFPIRPLKVLVVTSGGALTVTVTLEVVVPPVPVAVRV